MAAPKPGSKRWTSFLNDNAAKANVTPKEFLLRIESGLKFCNKCEQWKMLGSYHNDVNSKGGKHTICKSCKSLYGMKRCRDNSPEYIFIQYKKNAALRKYEFSLELLDFIKLKNSNCTYCGTFSNLGYDRIDNNIGYTKNNVTPCCSTCNFMKCDMVEKDWFSHMTKILANKGYIERDDR